MQTVPSNVSIHPDRAHLGAAAAAAIAEEIRRRQSHQSRVRMVFASAPSQAEMLHELVAAPGIDWGAIDAFHMDEYLGLPAGSPQRFGEWLRANLFDRVPFGSVNLIDVDGSPEATVNDYAAALADAPIDIVCCGIGVNGHLAFNDPPADLDDPADVTCVELPLACRQQQVDDACFGDLSEVPTRAITLTIPRLLRSGSIFCVVPGAAKAAAVAATFREPVSGQWPSTVLRTHPNCQFFFDEAAAVGLGQP